MASKNYFWKTARIKKETTDTVTIQFNTNGQAFSHKPGQFINLSMVLNGERHTRSYSLSSAPGDALPAVTIKKVPGGLVSSHIIDCAEQVREWTVDGPHGYFCWEDTAVERQVVLIGGGSGITPLFSILKYLLLNTTVNILLIDCNKTVDDIIFRQELLMMKKGFADRLGIYHVLSQQNESSNTDVNFVRGRLSKLVLKKY